MKDSLFQQSSLKEQRLVSDKILEEVKGRMMEDIVLLETMRSLPRYKHSFKLIMSRSEFDMVIYNEIDDTCELYEIKHNKVVSHQYHVLNDLDECKLVEHKYGSITKKCVLYRGESTIVDDGIIYQNVEEYLRQLV